jgi:hypothetical protein
VIVNPEPFRCKFLSLIDGFEQVMYQPVMANRSVVTLDISILLRLSGLNKSDLGATLFCPRAHCQTDVFGSVVTADHHRPSSPFNNLVKQPNEAYCPKVEIDVNT